MGAGLATVVTDALLSDRSARLFELCEERYGKGTGEAFHCAATIGPLAPSGPGAVCISDARRKLHRTTELIAVFAVAPFMIWLSTNKRLPPWARVASGAIGVGTLLVDGYLALRYTPMP